MSLACLVCHSVDSPSPSHSFRSYSASSSQNQGRCYAVATCLARKLSLPPHTAHSFIASSSSRVTPQPNVSNNNEIPGTPRLVRSRAVTRDQVRDWNFDEVVREPQSTIGDRKKAREFSCGIALEHNIHILPLLILLWVNSNSLSSFLVKEFWNM